MKVQVAKCIKVFNGIEIGAGFNLIPDHEYDVSLNDSGSLTLFHKNGWFTLGDGWKKYLELIDKESPIDYGYAIKHG